ncbi:MAG: hypothetical protein PHQ58_23285 [Rhodoferax sp.]|uniref:LPD7 domain-containing protein n=1 Tax=Rhodoferax sp. TaxID=50421 RepID=UPI00260C0EDE|nr:LPD7 domain-containing protein [Rhodoferax sp.]MDD2883344.1 hypothetical protein [Rhodoferax sp.]
METLTGEQQKRIALLDAFEAKTAPAREIRNGGIDQHEQQYREKWLQLQSSIEATRGDLQTRLKGLGASDQSISASVAIELAKLTEGYYAEKDRAARELDGTLVKPQSWLDFLKESKLEQPDDPIFDRLIEEAEKAPDSGQEGFSQQTAPNIVLADLQAREGKDGVMEYTRGLTVAVRDVGDRLDVRKTDDRDVEAALKIAAKKFDIDKGLLLTGDTTFKVRAAEISGKLGYPLQNTEPEVLRAWMWGKQVAQGLERAHIPGVEAGISGDPVKNLTIAPVGKSVLRADQRTMDILTKNPVAGIDLLGDDKISMPDERMLAANASIKDLGYQAIHQIAKVDLEQQNGGVDPGSVDLLREKGILDTDGKLTQLGTDVVMVRDDRVIRERETLEPSLSASIAQYFKTSGDYVREAFLAEREKAAPEVTEDKKEKALEEENAFQLGEKIPKTRQQVFEEELER